MLCIIEEKLFGWLDRVEGDYTILGDSVYDTFVVRGFLKIKENPYIGENDEFIGFFTDSPIRYISFNFLSKLVLTPQKKCYYIDFKNNSLDLKEVSIVRV